MIKMFKKSFLFFLQEIQETARNKQILRYQLGAFFIQFYGFFFMTTNCFVWAVTF